MERRDGGFMLEPEAGQRAPASTGERAVVALAVLVLAAGLVLAVGNAFVGDETATGPTASPAPASPGPRTPRPSPAPRVPRMVVVEPGDPPSLVASPPFFQGWIRAVEDAPIRATDSDDAEVIGTLRAGQVAYAAGDASGESGYVRLVDDAPFGFVRATDADPVARYSWPGHPLQTELLSLVSGGDRIGAAMAEWSMDSLHHRTVVRSSTDGATWSSSGVLPANAVWTMAHGPSAWISISGDGTENWVWHSADLETWEAIGTLPIVEADANLPHTIAGSSEGYLLAVHGGPAISSWFSADGARWHEMADLPLTTAGFLRLQWLAGGWYAFGDSRSEPAGRGAAFSPDGHVWLPVADVPHHLYAEIVAVGDEGFTIVVDPARGEPQAWWARREGGRLVWERDPAAERHFAGTAVTALASDGVRLRAFGWERGTEAALVWTYAGLWERERLPADFPGIPHLAVAGPDLDIVVGHAPTLRGRNPELWRSTIGGGWERIAAQPVEPLADRPAEGCAPPPTTDLELFSLDPGVAAACHGGRPLTFVSWSVDCDQCSFAPHRQASPAWLAAPAADQVLLTPVEGSFQSWFQSVLHPDASVDPAARFGWVEVTGHFDDPAAAECSADPRPDELLWYLGRDQLVVECRKRFVITSMREAEAPPGRVPRASPSFAPDPVPVPSASGGG